MQPGRRREQAYLISNLGALGAMVSAMAGLAGWGTCSVVGGEGEEKLLVVLVVVVENCRGGPSLQAAVESVANAGVGPRRGRTARMARIHGLCIKMWVGNPARGDSSLPRVWCSTGSRQNLCNGPMALPAGSVRVRLQGGDKAERWVESHWWSSDGLVAQSRCSLQPHHLPKRRTAHFGNPGDGKDSGP